MLSGLALFALLSSAFDREETTSVESTPFDYALTRDSPTDYSGFRLVPIDSLYRDIARYRGQHIKDLEPKMQERARNKDKEMSRMFLYSVHTLDRFLDVIKSLGESQSGKLAIRFYYGVYPEKMSLHGEDYGALHTLIMMPNYWSQKYERYMDIDLLGLKKYLEDKHLGTFDENVAELFYIESMYKQHGTKYHPVLMLEASAIESDNSKKRINKAGFFSVPEDAPAINEGQLCPPNCPKKSLLDAVDLAYPGGLQR